MLAAVKHRACPTKVPKPDEAGTMLHRGQHDVRIF
jgi:hypothetical protein